MGRSLELNVCVIAVEKKPKQIHCIFKVIQGCNRLDVQGCKLSGNLALAQAKFCSFIEIT